MPIVSKNPATLEILKTFEPISNDEVKSKIELSKNAFNKWKLLSIKARAQYFLKFIEVLDANKEEIAQTITLEMGKPIKVSRGEVEKCQWNAKYFIENTERLLKEDIIETEADESYVRFDPLGSILFVMPWNFPFWQAIRQAVPVLMSGNTVLLKHASNVPQSALKIEEMFAKAGFPEGVFQTLLIGSDQVEEVISDFRIKGISLTGSEAAGSAVASVAGKFLKKCVMELGGSDPFIIFEDANIDAAVSECASARLNNSGQVCNSPKRVVVMRSRSEEFINKLKVIYESKKLGNPMDESIDLGPLSMEGILNDVDSQVSKSIEIGAKLITGGSKVEGMTGYFYKPTILLLNEDKTAKEISQTNMPAYHEEIFGPVTTVIIVDTEEEAIEIANDTVYGLGASIWTNDIEKGKKYLPLVHAGAVYINQKVSSDPRLPIGGVNHSGFGRELSRYGLLEFTNVKAVSIKTV